MEEAATKRIEELVAQRVEEELERRREEIEAEVLRRVEEAKKVMEAQMLQEIEKRKQEQLEEAQRREVRRPGSWIMGRWAALFHSHTQGVWRIKQRYYYLPWKSKIRTIMIWLSRVNDRCLDIFFISNNTGPIDS